MASEHPALLPGGEILSALVHAVTDERPAEGTITAYCAHREPTAGGFCPDCERRVSILTQPGAVVHEEPDVLTVSTSEARTLAGCKRRYFFEYIMKRRPREQGHEAVWGAALHRGLEALFNVLRDAQDDGEPIDWALTVAEMRSAALTPGEDAQGRPFEAPADPYARAALSAILRAYVEYWWTDATTYEVVAVELPFRLPIKTRLGRLIKGKVCELCGGNGSINEVAQNREGDYDERTCPVCSGAGRIRPQREGRIDLVLRERKHRCTACGEPTDEDTSAPTACCGSLHAPRRTWITEHKSTGWAPTDERYYAGIGQDLQSALYYDAAREILRSDGVLGMVPVFDESLGVMYDVIRRPDYHEVKPAPQLKKDGQPRARKTEACAPCLGVGAIAGRDCQACSGTGRVTAEPMYSNPRHGETPATYEERIYRLATAEDTRSQWFGRRHLPITEKQVTSAREIMHNAADEIRWREKTGHWPEVGDRYVCAAPRKVCPWLDVCEGRASATDDKLYPLKRKDGV